MSFNYGREKFIFDREWSKLSEQYTQAGMTEEIDKTNTKTRFNLFQRFISLSTHFDEKENLQDVLLG